MRGNLIIANYICAQRSAILESPLTDIDNRGNNMECIVVITTCDVFNITSGKRVVTDTPYSARKSYSAYLSILTGALIHTCHPVFLAVMGYCRGYDQITGISLLAKCRRGAECNRMQSDISHAIDQIIFLPD